MTDILLAFDALTCRYGEATAVDGLTLEVRRGEMFGLIGPDGAGKTTALRAALGLLEPAAGKVRTCGLDPRRERHALADRVGYLSQRFSLYGDLTVDENIAFFAEIHGVAGWKRRREELLDLVRMKPFRKRLADRLSGGMKQKLALASTLIHRPELLVLDEPTTGVDPVSRRDFWKLLARLQRPLGGGGGELQRPLGGGGGELQREGLTLVTTTPYLDEAERCQRVALMDRGRLLAVDDPQALRRRYPGTIVELMARPRREAAAVLGESAGVESVEVFGERLHVHLPDVASGESPAAADRLVEDLRRAGIAVEHARSVTPSLEDVFIARIRAAEKESEEPREVA
jgi:ABC-2 type transport system ATP-binding protein